MRDSNDSTFLNRSSTNFLFENVNKLVTNFMPSYNRRNSIQFYKSVGATSHGTITFVNNKSNPADFIRISPDAPVQEVKQLLTQLWCGKQPSLVISITGGAKDYNMKQRLLTAFQRGLLKLARTTGAWIITGGTNTGVMKLVGDIIQLNTNRSPPIHLIGIATWGCVSNSEQLDVHGENVDYVTPHTSGSGQSPIDPNHTKFIFVDDGTVRKFGAEIEFRARLEKAISAGFFAPRSISFISEPNQPLAAQNSLRQEDSDPVPVVLLVVEGGPNTIKTVHEAVVHNNIPAVFLEGTGRCCDLFCKAIRLYDEYNEEFKHNTHNLHLSHASIEIRREELKNKLRAELTKELNEISGRSDISDTNFDKILRTTTVSPRKKSEKKPDTTDYFDLVYQCIDKQRNFLNIVTLDVRNSVEPDIDLAILQALLKATPGSDSREANLSRKREQLRLALEWNRVDIAKNYIMKNDQDWKRIDLTDMFELAINRDQIEFVKLFLQHDLSLSDVFRSPEKLLALYADKKDNNNEELRVPPNPLAAIYQEYIQKEIGDFFQIDTALGSQKQSSFYGLNRNNDNNIFSCCTTPLTDQHDAEPRSTYSESFQSNNYFGYQMDIYKELFFWSVIKDKYKFSYLFWGHGKNKICAALIATLIFRKHGRKNNDNILTTLADEFETMAIQILNQFYQTQSRWCTKAIIRRIPAFGNVTWLELAIEADAKQFIAQRAVQDILKNIWYGHIDQKVKLSTIIFSTIVLWYSGNLKYDTELVKTSKKMIFDEKSDKQRPSKNNQISTSNSTDKTRWYLVDEDEESDYGSRGLPEFEYHEKRKTGTRQYLKNIVRFLRAPCVKYIYNVYFHLIFLLLFSYVMLCDFFPLYDFPLDKCAPTKYATSLKDDNNNNNQSITSSGFDINENVLYGFQRHNRASATEWILAVWVFTLLCEEIRQYLSEAQTTQNALASYFEVFWNKLDVLAILLFYIGFILRFIPIAECFCAARIVLSADLTLWFIRTLDIFAAVRQLGPKLVMIGEMTQDLKFYIIMLFVFIFGFGVSTHSLMYGSREFNWHLPRDVVNLAYWHIFGELNELDSFENNYSPFGYAVFILLVIYMALVSILLVNLLIAMFSNTFDRLHTDTDRIWKFQRYSLVCEYLSRPSLPPPLIFFSHLWRCMVYILSEHMKFRQFRIIYRQHIERTQYQAEVDPMTIHLIENSEDAIGDEVYYSYSKSATKLVDENYFDEERVRTPYEDLCNKIRSLENQMQVMNNQQLEMFEYFDCLMDAFKTMKGVKAKMPKRHRFDHAKSYDDPTSNSDQPQQYDQRDTKDTIQQQLITTPDELQSSVIDILPS